MKRALTITKKELHTFFKSPVAYITISVFTLINAWFFIMPFFSTGNASLSNLFKSMQMVFLAYIPVITMGLIARERNNGTIEILMTMPVKSIEIVLGKYFFAISVLLVSILLTLVHFLTVVIFGSNLDYGVIFSSYLGVFLIGAVYSAIGIFTSSISNNQIIAFMLSFVISLILFFMEYALIFIPANLLPVFQYLSITWQYSNLAKGVIDSRVLIYFLSIISLFLYLSNLTLSSKKSI